VGDGEFVDVLETGAIGSRQSSSAQNQQGISYSKSLSSTEVIKILMNLHIPTKMRDLHKNLYDKKD